MSRDPAADLSAEALAPLRRAEALLERHKVAQALDELAPDRLSAALDAATRRAGRRAALPRRALEAHLPMASVAASLDALRVSHARASATWRAHAPPGGMLAGLDEVTIDGRAPEVSWYLSRLAAKMSRDKKIARPLEALAADLTAWEELVSSAAARARGALDAGRRRVRLSALAALLATTAAAGALASEARTTSLARARIAKTLALPDACEAARADPEDLERAGLAARYAVGTRRARCEAERRREAERSRCAELARGVGEARFEPDLAAREPPETRALLARMARAELTPDDLGSWPPSLPCGGSDAHAALSRRFLEAAARSTRAWETASHPSKDLALALRKAELALEPRALAHLERRADATAKRAVRGGAPEDIATARSLCDALEAMRVEPSRWCKALGVALARAKGRGKR